MRKLSIDIPAGNNFVLSHHLVVIISWPGKTKILKALKERCVKFYLRCILRVSNPTL